MYYVGVVTSTLFYAGILCLPMLFTTSLMIINSHFYGVFTSTFINAIIFGIPSLLAASFVIIYTMINVIPNTATWTGYLNYFSNY